MRHEKIVNRRYGKFAVPTVADKLPDPGPITQEAAREIAQLRLIEKEHDEIDCKGQAISVAYQFRVGFNHMMPVGLWAIAVPHPTVPGQWQALTHGHGVPPLNVRHGIPMNIKDMFVHPSLMEAMYQHVKSQSDFKQVA